MSQSIGHSLSEEDYQFIEANHLGTPLNIYTLKTIYPRIMQGLGLFLVGLGFVPPVIMITNVFLGSYKEQSDSVFYLIMLVVLAGFSILMGLFILYVEVPRIRNQHLIVCEQGLIEVRKRGWSKQVEAVHWQDIITIRKAMNVYSIVYQENRIIELDTMYQSLKILIEMTGQRSEIV